MLAIARYDIYQGLDAAQIAGTLDPQSGQPFPEAPVPLEVVGAPASKIRTSQPEGIPGDPQLPQGGGDVPGTPPSIPAQPIGGLGKVENVLAGNNATAPGLQ